MSDIKYYYVTHKTAFWIKQKGFNYECNASYLNGNFSFAPGVIKNDEVPDNVQTAALFAQVKHFARKNWNIVIDTFHTRYNRWAFKIIYNNQEFNQNGFENERAASIAMCEQLEKLFP
jgi:hypothetical protein